MGNGAMAKGPQATAPILDSTKAVFPQVEIPPGTSLLKSQTRGFLSTLSVIKTACAALQYFHGKGGTLASIRELFLDP
jgi:hypothetical protein